MVVVFACLTVVVGLVLLVTLPPSGSVAVATVELAAALLMAAVLALVFDRWNRSRIVDLRHNDLAESFRRGLIPREPELPEGAVRQRIRSVPTGSAPAPQHRLFGQCDCAECASGVRPATVDLRNAEVPSPGASPDDGRRTSSF